jgi:predicted transcriptional regulator
MAGRKQPVSLTRLEGEVMCVVWDAGPGPVRARDVLEALNRGRKKPLAYNTVQTVLSILRDKGVVSVETGSGRAHLFRARVAREDASHQMARELADRLAGQDLAPFLLQLIGSADLERSELEELRDWVDARLSDQPEGERGASSRRRKR